MYLMRPASSPVLCYSFGRRRQAGAQDERWGSAHSAAAQPRVQEQPARGSAWEPYLREGAARQAAPPEPVEPTLRQRLWGMGELVRGLWRRRDVHGARQLSEAALEVRISPAAACCSTQTLTLCEWSLLPRLRKLKPGVMHLSMLETQIGQLLSDGSVASCSPHVLITSMVAAGGGAER